MSQDDIQKLESVLSSEEALKLLEETTQQFETEQRVELSDVLPVTQSGAGCSASQESQLNVSLEDGIKELIHDGLVQYEGKSNVLRSPAEALNYLAGDGQAPAHGEEGGDTTDSGNKVCLAHEPSVMMDHCYTTNKTNSPEEKSVTAMEENLITTKEENLITTKEENVITTKEEPQSESTTPPPKHTRKQTGSPMRRSRRQQEKQEQLKLEEIKRENAEVERKWLEEQSQQKATDVMCKGKGKSVEHKNTADSKTEIGGQVKPSRMVTRGKRVPVGKMLGLREKVAHSEADDPQTENQKSPAKQKRTLGNIVDEDKRLDVQEHKKGKKRGPGNETDSVKNKNEHLKGFKGKLIKGKYVQLNKGSKNREIMAKARERRLGPKKVSPKAKKKRTELKLKNQLDEEHNMAEAKPVIPEKRKKHLSSGRDEKPYEIKKTASLDVPELFTPDIKVASTKEPNHKEKSGSVEEEAMDKSENGDQLTEYKSGDEEHKANTISPNPPKQDVSARLENTSNSKHLSSNEADNPEGNVPTKEKHNLPPTDKLIQDKSSQDVQKHKGHRSRSMSSDAAHRHGNRDKNKMPHRHSISASVSSERPDIKQSALKTAGHKNANEKTSTKISEKKHSHAHKQSKLKESQSGQESKPGENTKGTVKLHTPSKPKGEKEVKSHDKHDTPRRESKRERKPKVLDENEVSEVSTESEDDESESDGWTSDDDPEKLWCICKQPHDDRFMICCDSCEDWFHGNCVGITKKQASVFVLPFAN